MDKNVLYRFFAGNSSPEEQESIKAWSERSLSNKEQLMWERRFYDLLQLHLPESTEQSSLFRCLFSNRTVREILKIAVVALIAVMGSRWAMTPDDRLLVDTQVFSTPPGQRAQILLPDGTTVWLNARSRLSYTSDFNRGDDRRVNLDGEGYFEVTKNPERRFRVATRGCDFEVLGTTFSVEAYQEQPFVKAHLLSGSLKVMTNTGDVRDTVVLKPHEQVICCNSRLETTRFKNEDFLLWKEGLIAFDDARLEDILHLLEKSYGMKIKIEVGNERLKNITCTGKFRSNDGIDYALRVLQKSVNFTYIRDDDKGTITLR